MTTTACSTPTRGRNESFISPSSVNVQLTVGTLQSESQQPHYYSNTIYAFPFTRLQYYINMAEPERNRQPSDADHAACVVQQAYRVHVLAVRMARYQTAVACRDAQLEAEEASKAAAEAAEAARAHRTPLARVWPFAREAICIMLVAASLSFAPPPWRLSSLPDALEVRSADPASTQLEAAMLGAVCVVGILLAVVFILLGLLARGWHTTLSCTFTLLIGALLAFPTALLLLRCCEAAQLPVDAIGVVLPSWNLAVPGVLSFLWPARVSPQILILRRLYIGAAAALLAWVFSPVPWQTFVASALLVPLRTTRTYAAQRALVLRRLYSLTARARPSYGRSSSSTCSSCSLPARPCALSSSAPSSQRSYQASPSKSTDSRYSSATTLRMRHSVCMRRGSA